jgi:hypothetical protein
VPWLVPPFFVGVVGNLGIDPIGNFPDESFRVCLLDVELAQQFAQLVEV